jgi:translation initiation factor IF-1
MAKPKPPPPPRPQLRAGDVVVLRQSQEDVEGEVITVLGNDRYKVRWLTGSDYKNRVTTVTTEEVRRKS